jgi:GNAT superfamily N-acetyltransferase
MGLTPVLDTHIATIVTSLEMTARPLPSPSPSAPLSLHEWAKPTPKAYRTLFERVGAPWLWFSRLVMTDEALSAIIHHEAVKIRAVRDPKGIEVGILELDFREPGQCEIAYFGLVPELAGKGFGRWLMAQTLALAWRKDVNRVWVHTCTLDHSSALGFYQRSGFTPYARAVETFADPRLIGLLPRDAAPQIPLLTPAN